MGNVTGEQSRPEGKPGRDGRSRETGKTTGKCLHRCRDPDAGLRFRVRLGCLGMVGGRP